MIAEGHPDHPATHEIDALFTTNRTMDQVFRTAPSRHGHLLGPIASQRTPGLAFEMDADTAAPSGFYRSIVGDLGLRARAVTGAPPAPTWVDPGDFAVPGAAEVVAPGGVGLFGSLAKARDPKATAADELPDGARLRITREAEPASDGTRVFAVTRLGTSVDGYVRATGLAPRDSSATVAWSLDRSGPLLSPNADGANDALVVAARLSEPVSATLKVKNAAGDVVRSQTVSGDLVRFAWNLRDGSGKAVRDGAYTWSLRARDPWGNAGVSVERLVHRRRHRAHLEGDRPRHGRPRRLARHAGRRLARGQGRAIRRARRSQYRVGDGATRTYGGAGDDRHATGRSGSTIAPSTRPACARPGAT